ncbi:MAG: TetR/AcrR family transcriptional regulator [Parachlamydiales bacterium]|nr:TetR/AcrR family transcriptional regulator [Verrucomicrobiota bacterium]MBX3718985.1 TetR/AcrR family transcriptional regulator [Candidatus Acheromyda pituitae]
MSKIKKRVYRSEARAEMAALTKKRVLAEAKRLFRSKGFEDVTIEQLADAAGVSASTIFSVFKSKRGVLRVLMDEALPPHQFASLVNQAMQQKSAEEHLKVSARIARQIYDAEKSLMDIFRGASVLSPELKLLEKERELRRYQRQEETIKMMAESKSLAKGMTVSQARDILWALTGRDMYRMFVIDRGWSSDQYESWLGELLISTLIKGV